MLKKHVKWDVTGRCNLHCAHCLTGDKYIRSRELDRIGRELVVKKLAKGGVHLINLLGGEPLLLGEELFVLIKCCLEEGVKLTLNTNGTLLTPITAEKLLISGCSGINVSMDGPDCQSHDAIRGNGAFEQTSNNLLNLKWSGLSNNDMPVTLNTVLNSHNKHKIVDMLDVAVAVGASKWILLPLVITGYAADNKESLIVTGMERIDVVEQLAQRIDTVYNSYKGLEIDFQISYPPLRKLITSRTGWQLPSTQHCCMAGTTLGFVDPAGDLYPCDRLASEFRGVEINHVKASMHSLFAHSFDELWSQHYYDQLFAYVCSDEAYQNYEPCNRCEYLKEGLCVPCPLYGLRHKRIRYDFCLQAERELGKRALELEPEEKRGKFRYSGQFITSDAREVQPSDLYDLKQICELRVARQMHIRTGIRWAGAELYDTHKDQLFQLNFFGKEIWCRLNPERPIGEILDELADFVHIEKRSNLKDMGTVFIGSLIEKDLIEIV